MNEDRYMGPPPGDLEYFVEERRRHHTRPTRGGEQAGGPLAFLARMINAGRQNRPRPENGVSELFNLTREMLLLSPVAIVAQIALYYFIKIGWHLTQEDIATTIEGYLLLPTQEVYPETARYVARLLWLAPAISEVIYLLTGNTVWRKARNAILITDAVFDMIFRVGGFTLTFYFLVKLGVAAVQSFFLFTLGSELAVFYGVAAFLILLPYSTFQVFAIVAKLLALFNIRSRRFVNATTSLYNYLESQTKRGVFTG